MQNLLHDMNPSLKFITVTIAMLGLAFFFNPWTPLLFFFSILVLQLAFSRINWKLWSLFMLPFVIGAFGYLWTTIVFGAETGGIVIWSLLGFDVTDEQLALALSLSFRVLAFSSLSLLFALTTDPVKFVMSLMQQLKLSPKLAYGVLVGYQFLPVLKDEFFQIQQAHRLRGAAVEKFWWQRILGIRRVIIPMLAGAVRKAERSAFAMEARGFTGEMRKEFFRPVSIKAKDYSLSAAILAIFISTSILGSFMSI
ncbi:energy-coupling factor transporter transmembrane component T family protein [Planococcus halotolerans]|uniref:energy-coupling factor transporter transmembrane component T family protein n=1 Tax=Planococcus halotolerans TaxID=2233542 RepID=UPI00109283E1|nr:energy-coupling factor transporter transmembrane component T [Planococcus halotolerans]QHJ71238.1 cobalt transporter [Planococcus halotolerans]